MPSSNNEQSNVGNASGAGSNPVSHYLHPDYLDPRSPITDTKQSPLALLAATCNNIGKDLNQNITSPAKSDHSVGKKTEDRPANKPKSDPIPPRCESRGSGRKRPRGRESVGSSVCPDTSHESPIVSPNSSTPSGTNSGRSPPVPSKDTAHTSPAAVFVSNCLTEPNNPPKSSPSAYDAAAQSALSSGLLQSSLLNYGPYSSALGPWSTAAASLLAAGSSHTSSTCHDPYCLQCHVTHRPCLCMHCIHQKLISEPYPSLYSGVNLLGATSPTKPVAQAEYCMFCGKHCPTSEDLLTHMQLHLKTDSAHPTSPTSHLNGVGLGVYPNMDITRKMSAFANHPSSRFHPFRPPMPSRLAAHLAYPFGAGLV